MDYASSYRDCIDWGAERAARHESSIEHFTDEARERASEEFDAFSVDTMNYAYEHPMVVEAMHYAFTCSDECEAGRKMVRAIAAARMKWVNENWRRHAEAIVERGGV